MESCVLHLEIDDFLVAAAERCYPHLRGRAFVIAPLGADRARVQAASAPARTAGIHRGMLLKEAQKAEPRLWVHPLEERFYAALSGELVKILAGFSPVLEPWRYGQVYLEIFAGRAGWRQAREVAFRIQKEVVARLELKPAVGLGPNKLISRAASHRAARHHEILWVPPGHERPFIAPFRVQFLPHVNRRITGVLHNLNIWQVRELAALPRGQLQGLFGRVGWRIYEEARGIDPTPVMPPERRPGLYAEWAFAPETNDVEVIEGALVRLAGRVARRLRERGLLAGRLVLTATYADGRFFSGRRNLQPPAQLEAQLLSPAHALLQRLLARRVALRRLGVQVLHLQPPGQLELFAPETSPPQARLAAALDRIRARYGETAVMLGRERKALPIEEQK